MKQNSYNLMLKEMMLELLILQAIYADVPDTVQF